MPYIYNDEDNVAMNDPIETLNNITGYISFEEMRAVESGKYSAHKNEMKDVLMQKQDDDRLEWAKNVLPRMSCAWCPTAFRIYGQYKDQDDEWKAIDSKTGCANCKIFQEGN